MDLGKNTALFLLAAIAVFLMSTCSAQLYLAVAGTFQYTKDATGFGYGLVENRSSRPSLGGGAEYRKIWRANGFSVAYNLASTDAKFTAPGGKIQWGMLRRESTAGTFAPGAGTSRQSLPTPRLERGYLSPTEAGRPEEFLAWTTSLRL